MAGRGDARRRDADDRGLDMGGLDLLEGVTDRDRHLPPHQPRLRLNPWPTIIITTITNRRATASRMPPAPRWRRATNNGRRCAPPFSMPWRRRQPLHRPMTSPTEIGRAHV